METLSVADATKRLYQSSITVFTLKTLHDILPLESLDTFYLYLRKLVRLGVLEKLERGLYVLSDRAPDTFLIANVLRTPSYVSFESALNLYGILSQFPYEITSVTTKKPLQKTVQNKLYSYAHVQPSLFWGYEKQDHYLIANPEKAFLDQAYFAARGLRQFPLDEYDLARIDKTRLASYMKAIPQVPQVKKIMKDIRKAVRP